MESTIEVLFAQHREPLFRYLFILLRNSAEAEDVAQECFLRLYQEMRAQRTIDQTKSWLFRTGHNLAIDRYRTPEDRRERSLEASEPELACLHSPSSEDAMLRRERLALMWAAIERLPKQQRLCMHLRTEGFRYREIAVILDVSESTVSENLRRALVRLSKELHDQLGGL
ncbi:MAG: sigma-70 family RNA polymerase sigma factor [Acidobacteria bacterium]|nr:sigma-70 family RNA polymerase sigma factor [Acidobacteriota bacterium]